MIDLHSHLVWGYDDGARDEAESIAIARLCVADGVHTVVATPHVHGGYSWALPPKDLPERCATLNASLAAAGIPLTIVPGSEIYVGPETRAMLAECRGGCRPIGQSRYLLVEFAMGGTGDDADETIVALKSAGWRPILAHAERFQAFQRRRDRLSRLLAEGVLAQVNAGSLFGEFGDQARELAEHLLAADLVALIASDTHRAHHRPPRMSDGRRRVAELAGPERALLLTETNPGRVLADQPIETPGDPYSLHCSQRSFAFGGTT